MSKINPSFVPLFRLQRFMWMLFAIAYATITALYVAGASYANAVAVWSTIALLVLTGAKLIFIGSYFQKSGLKRHLVLTVLLVLLLMSVAFLEIFE